MMKLIVALVQLDDADPVVGALTAERISATIVEARGGFLHEGVAAILIGLDDGQVPHALTLLDRYCQSRRALAPEQFPSIERDWPLADIATVELGGATTFIVPVARFERF